MKRLYGFLSAALVALCMMVSVVPASAASDIGSSSLSIAPRKDYRVDPGGSVEDKLTISNPDKVAGLSLNVRMVDFTFMDQSGTPKLMTGSNAPQTTWSLKPFITMPSAVTIDPGKSATVNIKVSVPKGQGAGSYYGAIVYSAANSGDGNVGLSATGVTLVFLSVPGTVNEGMNLQKFGAYIENQKVANEGSFVYITVDKPKELAYTLTNTGNVAEQPIGSITMRNMFGGKDITIDDANPHSSLALRGQTRLFTACINPDTKPVDLGGSVTQATTCKDASLLPGRYTATLDVFYGQNGNNTREITETAVFWYLPWWFIIGFLIFLVILGSFIWWLQKKVRDAISGSKPKRFRR